MLLAGLGLLLSGASVRLREVATEWAGGSFVLTIVVYVVA